MLNIPKDQKYILACSYGPDSMALFDMLEKEGFDFVVAHVNYGLREECYKETEDLENYCKLHSKTLFIKRIIDFNKKSNLEAECREIRYKFFKDITVETGISNVLIAHNKDDLIETYLLQKRRKSLVKYYGLKNETDFDKYHIYRPLLDIRKTNLEEYCLNNNVPFAIDSSNLSDDFLRNKIRHEIVSKFDDKDIQVVEGEISKNNVELACIFEKLSSSSLNDLDCLLGLNDTELAYALNELSHDVIPSYSISLKCVQEIRKVLLSKKPNVELKINKKITFVKTYGKCYFEKPSLPSFYFVIDKPCIIDNEYFYLNLNSDTSNMHITKDDYPLIIRTINPKDVYLVNGYQVEARRLLIDWKMPLDLRKRWPVIVNNKGIVTFIPRYRSNFVTNPSLNVFVK